MPVYQQFIRNTFISYHVIMFQYNHNTEDNDHQISACERNEIVVHGSVEMRAPNDDIAHRDVPDDPRHENCQVEDRDDDEGVGVLHLFGAEDDQQIFLKDCSVRWKVKFLLCTDWSRLD